MFIRTLLFFVGVLVVFGGCGKDRRQAPGAQALSDKRDAAPTGDTADSSADLHPARTVAQLRQPTDLAIDGAALYVVDVDPADENNLSDIVKISLPDGQIERIATKQRNGQSLVLLGPDLVWFLSGDADHEAPDAIFRMPKGGGKPARLAVTFVSGDDALAARDGALYFHGPVGPKGKSAVLKLPVAAGATPKKIADSDQNAQRQVLAVDALNVYWAETRQIMRAPVAGGAAGKLADATQVRGMISDGQHLYWTDAGGGGPHEGTVRRVAVHGGTVETIHEKDTRPWGIALDEQAVYWVTNDDADGAVYRRSKRAPSVLKITGGQSAPVRIVVDGANIYWTNAGNGAVMAATK